MTKTIKQSLLITFLLLIIVSCENWRKIASGNLDIGDTYNIYFYNYTSVGEKNKKTFRDCKVFVTHIRNSEKKLKEIIFWYSCDTILPIKFFAAKDSINGPAKANLLIADTTTNYLVPLNENEREVIGVANEYFSKKGFPTFAIKGFKYLSRQDSLARLPLLKSTLEYHRNLRQ